MSDLKAYISKRRAKDQAFDEGFDDGYKAFKIGALLKQAREDSGLTQAEMAERLHTQKSAISRLRITLKISGYPHWKSLRRFLVVHWKCQFVETVRQQQIA